MTYPQEILDIENDEEKDIAILLHNMSLKFKEANYKIIENKQPFVEIDLIFTHEKFLFIIEVSKLTGTKLANKKMAFFSKWEKDDYINQIRKSLKIPNKKIIKIYFDFSKTNYKEESDSINNFLKKQKDAIIAYSDDIEYFKKSSKIIGTWSINDFIDWIGISGKVETTPIEAIQFYLQDLPVYCFVENVSVLLKSCYISRRRRSAVDLGYQRTLDEKQIRSIQQNIEKEKGLSFPNSILIHSPKLVDKKFDKDECPIRTSINFPTNYCSCRIIDGQHRLLGFSKIDPEKLDQYYLTVIALTDITQKQEFETFIEINSRQKKMDNNLILHLKSDFEWTPGSPEDEDRKCVKVAEMLDKKILKNRIYFGTDDGPRKNRITLVTIKTALRNNQQILETEDKMFKKISKIFRDLGESMPHHMESTGYFQQNSGIRFLFRLVNLFERNRVAGKISIKQIDFFKDVNSILTEEFLETVKNLYGSSSGIVTVRELVIKLREEFPKKYGNMHEDLKGI